MLSREINFWNGEVRILVNHSPIKTTKILTEQLKSAISELWKCIKATERTENPLSKRNYWTWIEEWCLWNCNWGLSLSSLSLPPYLWPWKASRLTAHGEHWPLWCHVKSPIPRPQTIFVQISSYQETSIPKVLWLCDVTWDSGWTFPKALPKKKREKNRKKNSNLL